MNNQRRGSNPNEIGAAWIKTSQKGEEYISIVLKEEAQNFDLNNCFIDMYVNNNKRSQNQPDYRITAKPKQQRQSQRPRPQQAPQRGSFPRPGAPRPQRQAPPSNGGYDDDGDPGY